MDELSLKERIENKISQIEQYEDELASFRISNFEEYQKNPGNKAACERYIEKIAESSVDLAILFIRLKKLESPEDDDYSFEILEKNKIIEPELATRIKDLKGMRNRLAHRYEEVDDKLVFEAVNLEIERDMTELIKAIREGIK